MPKRIQMSRQRPWRAEHPDAVIVARPSKWGNPYRVYKHCKGRGGDWGVEGTSTHGWTRYGAQKFATDCYRALMAGRDRSVWDLSELAGHDLACWCPLDQPCHADFLLELANGGDS